MRGYMDRGSHFPTLWNPEELFSHLARWAGVPAGIVIVVAGALALYQSVRGWKDFADGTNKWLRRAKALGLDITTVRQRAAGRFALCSVLATAFAYALAVIIYGVVQVAEVNPNALLSSKVVENAVVVTQWSSVSIWTAILAVAGIALFGIACIGDMVALRKLISFLGGFACAVAWVAGTGLGVDALIGFALRGSQNPPPMSLLVTEVITALLFLALGWLLPKVNSASRTAFNA
jgi:hypothetical protein